ncbi:MAG: hypothetical protein U5L01_11700 [Rheinheimera sp.]|nr:hypothetical protein [Rheinheimera sp.]
MIEEIATVIGVEADGVWVKTQAKPLVVLASSKTPAPAVLLPKR